MTATLKPGPYELEISSQRPQRLTIDAPAGAGLYEIAATVTLGWFTAQARSGEGLFTLFNYAGEELFNFEGTKIDQ